MDEPRPGAPRRARDEVRFQQLAANVASTFADSTWTGASAKLHVLNSDAIGLESSS